MAVRKFILKVILFATPITLIFIFPIFILILSKEYYTLEQIAVIQNNDKSVIYGTAYNIDAPIPYKQSLFQMSDPDIIVLGTSRSAQIRKEFFSSSSIFINTGIPGFGNINGMKYFVENIPLTKHRLLLFDIDRELFTADPTSDNPHDDSYFSLFGFEFRLPLQPIKGIYLDYFLRHKYALATLFQNADNTTNKIGLRAIIYGQGFRSDGSTNTHTHESSPAAVLRQADEQAKKIFETKDNFSSLENESIEANLKTLREIISICKSKNIDVVGFISPYITSFNTAAMNGDSLNGRRNITITNSIETIFKENNLDFFDLSDISKYRGFDTEFNDIIHATDLLYAKLSLYLAKNDKRISAYFNMNALRDMIKNAQGNILAF